MIAKGKALILLGLLVAALAIFFAIPAFVGVPRVEPYMRCVANLRAIEMAKELYAEEHHLMSNGVVLVDDILTPGQFSTNHLTHGFASLVCPLGGTYSINRLSQLPTCSFASQDKRHSLRRTRRK